ncbi:hypothetical protein H0A66_14190 [Alcaligenaceae bacterium]|nr:hypothetical protein [Alcaligenaceae bacterium]
MGTAGSDTIQAIVDNTQIGAVNDTLGAMDNIDGGAGRDTLVIEGNQSLAGTIKNVEIFQFVGSTNVGSGTAIDASAYAGLDTISLKNVVDSSVVVNKMLNNSTIDLVGSTAAGVHANLVATATNANITSSALTAHNAVSFTGAALKTVSFVGETGALANGGGIFINAAPATTTVNVKATGTTLLEISGTKVATIDASASSGNANIVIGAVAADLTVKGGAGDDVVEMNLAALSTKDSIDLGAGNDNMIFKIDASKAGAQTNYNVAAGVVTITTGTADGYALINKVGAEQVTFNLTGVTAETLSIDASKLTADKIGMMDSGSVNKLLNADTVISSTTGKALALTALRDTADPTKFAADAGTVNLESTTKGDFVNVTTNGIAGGSDFATLVLTGKGNVNFDNANGTLATSIDASGLSGSLNFKAGAKIETITLGSGKDVVDFTATQSSTYAATDVVTSFSTGDVLDLGVTGKANMVKFDATGAVSFEQALTQAVDSVANDASKAAWFTWTDGNTYVVKDTDTSKTVIDQNSGDLVIKLAGALDLTADGSGIILA